MQKKLKRPRFVCGYTIRIKRFQITLVPFNTTIATPEIYWPFQKLTNFIEGLATLNILICDLFYLHENPISYVAFLLIKFKLKYF